MSFLHKIMHFLLAAPLCVIAAGCIYDDMNECPSKLDIMIMNDWQGIRNANPEGMAYVFYPNGDPGFWRFDFKGLRAGTVSLPPSEYGFVMYNDDTSRIDFFRKPQGNLFATTGIDDLHLPADSGENCTQPLKKAPDMLWGWGINEVDVEYGGLVYGGTVHNDMVLRTFPRQLTPHYSLTVRNVVNLHGVEGIIGKITGQSSGVDISSRERSDTLVSVPFRLSVLPDSTLKAGFMTFGATLKKEDRSNVVIYFKLTDGKTVVFSKDMTEKIYKAPDPYDISLEIDTIRLPWSPPAGQLPGAFNPTVEDWVEISIDYET